MKKTLGCVATLFSLAMLAPAADVTLPRKAPELQFTVPGQGAELLSQLRGKVIALEFVLTTCPHCQAAAHVMSNFQREYGPRGLQAVDVAINATDENRTPDQAAALVQNFTNQYQVGFPVGYATRDEMAAFMDFSLAERFVVPQVILIDRKGMIHYQTPPLGDEHATREDVLRQRIEELLAIPTGGAGHPVAKGKTAVRKPS